MKFKSQIVSIMKNYNIINQFEGFLIMLIWTRVIYHH